jgi:hypothetical protein
MGRPRPPSNAPGFLPRFDWKSRSAWRIMSGGSEVPGNTPGLVGLAGARPPSRAFTPTGDLAMTTRRRSSGWLCPALAALGLFLAHGLAAPARAADATGTWKWTVERNGNTFESTLKLKQDGDKLTGTITGRNGTETAIEDGKVAGDTVAFKVTREFNNNKIVFLYDGKLSGDAIKGETKFQRDGETQSFPWEAKRAP